MAVGKQGPDFFSFDSPHIRISWVIKTEVIPNNAALWPQNPQHLACNLHLDLRVKDGSEHGGLYDKIKFGISAFQLSGAPAFQFYLRGTQPSCLGDPLRQQINAADV